MGPGGGRERGQSLVEFALSAPLLIVLLLGLADLGLGLNSYLTVVAGARDGARLGAEGGASDAQIVSLVLKEAERLPASIPATCNPGNEGVCVSHPTIDSDPAVKVEVCYNHPLIVGVPGVLPNPLLMCSKTAMRVVQ